MSEEPPTPTALAARALLERIDNRSYMQALENRAVLGGWVGSREYGSYDTRLSDAIAKAALGAVLDLLRTWAAECGEVTAAPDGEPQALREEIARCILAQKVPCPGHPLPFPKPSCWACGRNGAFQRAARIALGKFPA